MKNMNNTFLLKENKKIYFISDLHLGLYPADKSAEREKKAVSWLDAIHADAQVLFLLGDIFDFWYEYKYVARQGFIRFLGQLAALSDSGVDIHLFCGNHDMWYFNYLKKEIGLTLHRDVYSFSCKGKKFLVGHGDGIGPGDVSYKLMKSAFRNRILQWFFSHLLHPDFSMWLGNQWSKHSRYGKGLKETFRGENKECQIQYARNVLKKEFFDYFIFGHRHYAYDLTLDEKSRILNLGEWITQSNYAVFDGFELQLKQF